MTKLNQILAVEKTAKSEGEKALTAAYQDVQKAPLYTGISRTYQPRDEEGTHLPPETQYVTKTVDAILSDLGRDMARLFDVTLTKDAGNLNAVADIVVDGATLLADVPVTYLLFLEKKLVDFKTFVSKLPVLDPSVRWTEDESLGEGVRRSEEVKTTKTNKVPRNHVLAPATDKHPAQVQVYHEDVVVGDWTTVRFSGAIPATRRAELINRVNKLSDAVKIARETANGIEVTDRTAGDAVLGYLFA